MQKQAPKIIVIMGPTASGKSGVAIELAKKFNGEIISADSRQVYRGMDIGTGKVVKQLTTNNLQLTTNSDAYISEGVVHHLIDVTDPMEDFNVSHFKTLAEKAIEEILAKGKVPIICGGTAFWIDAVVNDVAIPEVAPDEVLRSMLRSKTNEELFRILKNKDPERAQTIDAKNQVRLIRAIEICEKLGKVPRQESGIRNQESGKYSFLQIGIDAEKEVLHEKIQRRLDERFTEGMIEEVENLNKNGVSWEWMERIGLEYRWISRFLQGKIHLEEMSAKGGCASGAKKLLYFDIIHYAKRQMTWLKRNKNIIWCDEYGEIEKEVAKFLVKKS